MTHDDLRRTLSDAVPYPPRVVPADEVLQLARRRRRRRLNAAGGLAVLVVVAVVVVPFAFRSERGELPPLQVFSPDPSPAPVDRPDPAAVCPQTYLAAVPTPVAGGEASDAAARARRAARAALWVPAAPTADGARRRVVPAEIPRSAVLCKYAGAAPSRLEGAKDLGGVELIADDLNLPLETDRPRGTCQLYRPAAPYLLRLDYPSGVVWVTTLAEGNMCAEVTNGAATSPLHISGDFAAAYGAGRWGVAADREGDSCAGRFGRAGEEHDVLPPGAITLRVCDRTRGSLSRITDPLAIARVAALLNSAPTPPGDGSCKGLPTLTHLLAADYERGRSVDIPIFQGTSCGPSAGPATLTDAQLAQLLALVGLRNNFSRTAEAPCNRRFESAGDETVMMPPAAAGLRVCDERGLREFAHITDGEKVRRAEHILNSAPTVSAVCAQRIVYVRHLIAEYADGRGRRISIYRGDACGPAARSGDLVVRLSETQLTQLLALTEA